MTEFDTGQIVAFWIFGPLAIALALGMVFSRKPVHSALSLAGMMVSLACLYATLSAPLLFVVQIIVYTGAVMMLFVFTMMIIGVDSTDAMIETLKGHRTLSIIGVVALAALLILAVGNGIVTGSAGIQGATETGNLPGLAELIFGRWVFAFEATAALLIVAVLAAMILAHGETLRPKATQKQQAAYRIKRFATDGVSPAPLTGSGNYARHNSNDYPALLPDGSVDPTSISPTLAVRGAAIVDNEGLRNVHLAVNQSLSKAWDEMSGEDTASKYQLDTTKQVRRGLALTDVVDEIDGDEVTDWPESLNRIEPGMADVLAAELGDGPVTDPAQQVIAEREQAKEGDA